MKSRLTCVFALMIFLPALSGCAPLAVGAAGAVVADEAVENEGGNLF